VKVCLAYPLYLPYVGGIELYIDELATGLASDGHEVCIFTSKLTDELLKTNLKLRFTGTGGHTESEFKDNIYIRRFEPSQYLPIGRIATNQFLFEYSEALRRFVGKNQFDVINWHTADKCGFSLLTGYNSRSGNVLTLHGSCYPITDKLFLNRLFIKSVLKKADTIICVTEDARRGVAHFNIDQRKVHVISNWVDTAHFSPIQRRAVPDGFKRVLYVGLMVREKGVDLLIETIKELIDAGLKIKGIFVGDGPDLPYFKTLATKLCIGEYLTFVGSIPHKETAQFYSIADVFVLLSV
jgi:glycosyltransferase involved in cell wall biosynthesis